MNWTTETMHGPDCAECQDAIAAAVTYARVTGSVGATWRVDHHARGAHWAKVTREVTP